MQGEYASHPIRFVSLASKRVGAVATSTLKNDAPRRSHVGSDPPPPRKEAVMKQLRLNEIR